MGEGIELAAEAAAVRAWRSPGCGPAASRGPWQEPVHVVRRLRRGPERELAVGTRWATAACCSIGRCVLPSKKNTSSRDEVGLGGSRPPRRPNSNDTSLWTFAVAVLVDAGLQERERASSIGHRRGAGLVLHVDERGALGRGLSSTATTAATGRPPTAPFRRRGVLVLATGRMPKFIRGRSAPTTVVRRPARPRAGGVDAPDEGVRVRARKSLP